MALNYNSPVLERSFLRSIIAQPSVIPEVSQIATFDDFLNPTYGEIYKALLDLYSNEIPFCTTSIFSELQKNNVTFTAEDTTLLEDEVPVDPPLALAEAIRKMSVERDIYKLASDLPKVVANQSDTLTVIGETKDKLDDFSKRLIKNDDVSYTESLANFFDKITQDEEEVEDFIPSPYPTLNGYLYGGFKANQLITVGARPGVGKTVVATNCVAEACKRGKSVLLFSLEMSKDEVYQRLIACYGNILLNKLKAGEGKTTELREKLTAVEEDMKQWKLEVVDDADVTMEVIKAKAQLKAQSKDGLDFVIIDYLQLISTRNSRGRSRQEEVAEMSRSCKMMAKQLKCPVMILVQIKREEKGDDEDRIPSKADIRESGAIAADSDVVLILHRKPRDDSQDPKALFILDKNRAGPTDKIFQVRCVLEKNIFQDLKGSNQTDGVSEDDGWGDPNDIVDDVLDDYSDDDYGDMFGEFE